jgi:Secretion system C-terminal sorting domain
MKHILLISFCLLLNMLASAQALTTRNSPNPQGKTFSESTQVIDITQINDIQAMVRGKNPSQTFVVKGREKIIVEEQVLFTRPDVVTSTIGTAVMRFPEMSEGLDVILNPQLSSNNSASTVKQAQAPTNAQNNDSNATIEILDNIDVKQNNAAQKQDTDSYIHISPNPISVAALVEIENAPLSIQGTFQVFDITGRLLNAGQFEGNQFILERKSLNKGVYILRILSENSAIASKKIIVN